jgi:hypothetical protein
MDEELSIIHGAEDYVRPNYVRSSDHRFSLLRTCRQIYAETASLPYALSVFSFLDLEYISNWLQGLTPADYRRAQSIQSVRESGVSLT